MRSLFAEVRKNLTAGQIVEIEQKVKEYLKTHTVHYQKRIKDYEYTLDSIKQAKP
ncbi:hypothetical protein L4C38_11740 [Vibrio kasasachensis]|uniref:hypothetical protein n=1 Tax=Vibrio kasasachensis TaxID=2910248 RepID=UPI003D14FDFE